MKITQQEIDHLRLLSVAAQGNWIANEDHPAMDGRSLPVISPVDGRQITTIAASSKADLDCAVASARQCFEQGSWCRIAPLDRKRILLKWADLIERHAHEIAVLGVRDNGTEIEMALKGEPLSAAATIRFYAEAIDKVSGEIAPTRHGCLGLIHREPVGVVGATVPWNFPLMIGAWKLAPALAVGNSVVLKPSEEASLSLLRIARLAAEAGLPAGALNVVTGTGIEVGQALASHMDVDVLAFTGSAAVGRLLLQYAAQSNLKRVYLELGGKSPNLVFADASDLERAARETAASIFRNSGQVCVSASRLLIERPVYERFLEMVVTEAGKLRIGDPLDLANTTGALATAGQLQKTLAAVHRATQQGARLASGGKQLHLESGGFYHAPTVLAEVTSQMDISHDEIFGPVLAVRPFDTEEEAYRIANETLYGLSSLVWTSSLNRAHRAIGAIKSGVVQVNSYTGADVTIPLGGIKQSGNGYDRSLHALDQYIHLKSAWIAHDA